MEQTDWLGVRAALTDPMRYDAAGQICAGRLERGRTFADRAPSPGAGQPDEAEFYTSGRTPNEAAFLYSIFACAEFRDEQFPRLLRICTTSPASRGLPLSVGIGRAPWSWSFPEHADHFHPRAEYRQFATHDVSTLVEAQSAASRSSQSNRCRASADQHYRATRTSMQMATFGSTDHQASSCIRISGDLSAAEGMIESCSGRSGRRGILDHDFLHCNLWSGVGRSRRSGPRVTGIVAASRRGRRSTAPKSISRPCDDDLLQHGHHQQLRGRPGPAGREPVCCSRAISAGGAGISPIAAIPTSGRPPSASTRNRQRPI